MARRKGSITITLNNLDELKAAQHALLEYQRLYPEGCHDHKGYEVSIVERHMAVKIYSLTREEV